MVSALIAINSNLILQYPSSLLQWLHRWQVPMAYGYFHNSLVVHPRVQSIFLQASPCHSNAVSMSTSFKWYNLSDLTNLTLQDLFLEVVLELLSAQTFFKRYRWSLKDQILVSLAVEMRSTYQWTLFNWLVGVTPNSRRFDASIGGAWFDSQSHSRIFAGCYDHAILAIWGCSMSDFT